MIRFIRNCKPFVAALGLFALSALTAACGSSGSNAKNVDGDGNESGSLIHPKVSAVEPADQATAVSAFTQLSILFDRAMKPASFETGTQIDPSAFFKSAACETLDCKKIVITFAMALIFDKTYTLTLNSGEGGIEDVDGNRLEADFVWSFTVETFTPPFVSLILDGNGMTEQAVDENGTPKTDENGVPVMIPINDAGECTTIAIDENDLDRTIHITYLSVSNSAPKHAFCKGMEDCSQLTNWTKELIDPSALAIGSNQKLGRDINMAIESLGASTPGRLHVSYRDFETPLIHFGASQGEIDDYLTDGLNIIKYAKKDPTGTWTTPVIIDDTTDGVTDTYIKVDDNGRIHISYHARNQRYVNGDWEMRHSLMYATCSQSLAVDCLSPSHWIVTDVDGGSTLGDNNYAQPSFIFIEGNDIHISYYANSKLKYASCTFDENVPTSCTNQGPSNWKKVFVDTPGPGGDLGADSSIFVDAAGIQITYRDNRDNGADTQLKYAFCPTAADCFTPSNWKTITVDPLEGSGLSTQLKIDDLSRRHLVYGDFINDHLRYAFCGEIDCADPANWHIQIVGLDAGEDNYISVGDQGGTKTIYLSSRDHSTAALKFVFGPSVQ